MSEKFEHPRLQERLLVFYTADDEEILTNTVLMLSAYLVLAHKYTVEEALHPFSMIDGIPLKDYLDATYCQPTMTLSLEWCTRGLARAMELGWIDPASFDVDDYERFDDPGFLNANAINPKFIAFLGPETKSLQKQWNQFMHEPGEYVEEFQKRGVSTVVRLNEPSTYDKAVFERAGIEVVDLEFRDCTTPSPSIIKRFLDAVDNAKGVVAVHCMAGLGRTGTLIAIHMMKHDGFSGLEAIGFVRLMRPGSIIGPQQEFLRDLDDVVWDGNMIVSQHGVGPVDLVQAEKMAEQVASAAKGRGARA
jgi:cell division cycle 14